MSPTYFIYITKFGGIRAVTCPTNHSEPINIDSTRIYAFAPRIQQHKTTLSTHSATGNTTMASAKPLTMLVARCRPAATLSASLHPSTTTTANRVTAAAAFSTTALRHATPSGPPPAGFRLPRPERWDESKESSLDKAGKYFLMTEMARGMYVVLEQYFRPPCVAPLKALSLSAEEALIDFQIHHLLSFREGMRVADAIQANSGC
jgi:hypothetical protein